MDLSIETNQNVQIKYKICSLSDRILAYIIDSLVIAGILIALFMGSSMVSSSTRGPGLYLSLIFIPIFFYHLVCELTMNGQSIGKRARNIKVMKVDGSSCSFSNYFLRFLLRPIDSTYAVGLAFIFFTEKAQRLGDLAAGTVIIEVKNELSLQDIRYQKVDTEKEIKFPEVNLLKDKDITLINKILSRRMQDPGHENIHALALKVKEILNVTTEMHDYEFLLQVVSDFHAYYEA